MPDRGPRNVFGLHRPSAPMSNIDTLTVLSTDGAGALPKQVVKGFAEVDSLLEGATGVSLRTLVNGAVSGTAAGAAAGRAVVSSNGDGAAK